MAASSTTTHNAPRNRKRKVAFVAVLLVLAAAAGAYSWWSSTGSGTGSASTGDVTAIDVNQTSPVSDLAPGKAAQAVSGNFDNGNDGPVYISTVTVSIDSVDKAPGAPAGNCDASDYTLANATATVNANVAAGTGVGAWSGPTLAFNNKASNQDGCKGATVNLAFSAS